MEKNSIHSDTNGTNITILIGGWGDFDKHLTKIKEKLEHDKRYVHHFRYGRKNDLLLGRFSSLETLAEQLFKFLQTQNYLESPNYSINLIGYSQGGMIGLLATGMYPEIRSRINKIITIASPHGGILEKSLRQTIIVGYNFMKPWLNSNFFGKITTAVMDFALESLDLVNFLDNNGLFLERLYPTTVKQVFQDIPKDRIMQIYSPTDYIARPESCARFQEHMIMLSMDNHDHQEIIQNDDVIQEVVKFLSNERIN